MDFKLDINVKIEVVYDSQKEEFKVISCIPKISEKKKIDTTKTIIHEITETQKKFGILTLGSKNAIGEILPKEKSIRIKFNGEEYTDRRVSTHKTTKGRIDGLTSLYAKYPEIQVGTKMEISFDVKTNILDIKIL